MSRVPKDYWPEEWDVKTLDEICTLQIGRTPSRSNQTYWANGVHTWVSIADMTSRVVLSSKEQVTDKAVEDRKAVLVPEGSLLMSFKLTIGKLAFAGKDLFTNEAIVALNLKPQFKGKIEPDYLYWVLQAVPLEKESIFAVKGRTLNTDKLKRIEIPVPEPVEQQRIVARIEALLAEVQELQRLHGEITTDADKLIKAVLAEIIPSIDTTMPDGWSLKTIREISNKPQYGYTQSSQSEPVGPKFLRITDIQKGKVDWSTVPFCECNAKCLEKYQLKKNDIVFARSGATTGKTFLIKDPPEESVFASYLIRLQIKDVVPEYVYWFFQSPQYWRQVTPIGAAIPNMNATVLQGVKIPIPSSEHLQIQIVSRLNTINREVDEIISGQIEEENFLEQLESSILSQAFQGGI